MIQLYAAGTTNFSKNGITLHPSDASVTFQDNGQFDLDMEIPADSEYADFDYGQILRVTVPTQHIDQIDLGSVSYYTVSNAEGTALYSQIPSTRGVSYNAWQAMRSYMAGDKVTYDKKNWRCVTGHGGLSVPPPNGGLWTQISGTAEDPGKTITTLAVSTEIMKVSDFNEDYMEAATVTGYRGYVKKSDCTATGQTGEQTIAARTITAQSFMITNIKKTQNGKKIRISAEHISYQLGRTQLGDCNVVGVSPQTALLFIAGAMKESYGGTLATNITDIVIDADWSWKNAQNAIMDPKAGLLSVTGGHLVRDDLDVFILANEEQTPRYTVRYGANMKDVTWTGSVDDLVTRIYPTAKTEDGRTLLLPEEYIDSVRDVPFIRPEVLNTGLQVGKEIENSDGTKTTLTESEVYARMRTAADERFTIDKCDMAEVNLDLDWEHMPDTEEYAQYIVLRNVAPGDWVEVTNGPLGVSAIIQMTGYVWNPLTERYTRATFGPLKTKPTVAGYSLQSGSVTARAIAGGAITGEHIRAGTITAREIEAGSITADKIASRIITAELIQAGAITATEIAAESITAEHIQANAIEAIHISARAITAEKIDAGAITAEKIAAGAITADKIDAGAITAQHIASGSVTTDKLSAGAVTADKIDAGSINADKIDATDLTAINAKLGTANIARAEIASADINYAHVKDLAADLAIFSTTITEQGIADRLFINRLMITYGQMVSATIGDLVIGASDGHYYHVDIEWDEDGVPTLVPTQVDTPTAEEIADGHTTDGHTIIGNIGTFAELSSEDFYAINAIIDRITAKRIDVDELWARQAFIDKLMVQDISSNTYIQSTIGNWQSQSTITQTIGSIQSRISELGYGTIYYSMTEPSHSGLVQGDIWVQPLEDNTWDDVRLQTWQQLIDNGTWSDVMGAYKVYTWTGDHFRPIFDSLINVEMQTQIDQNTYAITLKADQSALNTIEGTVADFGAILEVQSTEINAAVSAVNTKASSYVMWADPTTVYTVTLGDIWIKSQNEFGSWLSAAGFTWDYLKTNYTWGDALVSETYVWDGTKWVQTSDRASSIQQETEIRETATSISLLAETAAKLGGEATDLRAQLTVANDRITTEVSRATTAEGGKLDKTTRYQTAEQIYSAAVRQAGTDAAEGFIAKTEVLQTADQIKSTAVAEANANTSTNYIAKTTQLQTAEKIYSEAVKQAGVNAKENYIKKTSVLQTADQIVSEAVSQANTSASGSFVTKTTQLQTAGQIVSAAENYTDNQLTNYSTITQTASAISAYVQDNAYCIRSGIEITAEGISVSGSQYVTIASGGYFQVTTGNFGIDSNSNNYVIWSGAAAAATSPFRVKKDGTVYLTKLIAVGESGSESEVNLRTAGLWKLNYHTVKSYTTSSLTLSNGTVINFIDASSLSVQPDGAGNVYVMSGQTAISDTAKAITAGVMYDGGGPTYSNGHMSVPVRIYLGGSQLVRSDIVLEYPDTEGSGRAYDAALATFYRSGYYTLYWKSSSGNYYSMGYHDWYYR